MDTKSDNDDTYDADYQPETTSMARYENIATLAFPIKVSECDDICNTADCLPLSENQGSAIVTAMVSAGFKAEGDDLNIQQFLHVVLNNASLRMIFRCAN